MGFCLIALLMLPLSMAEFEIDRHIRARTCHYCHSLSVW